VKVKEDRRAAMRILLVDDEPALRELLRAALEGADVTVEEAESGLEAEARIRRRPPDVVVLDLRMPGMSGAELCARLKADPRTREIPIVLLTGADEEEARRAKRAGAAALVRKPFSPLDLLAVVERVSGRQSVPRRPRRPKAAEEELVLYARDLRHLLEIERRQRELLQESYLATVSSLASALESRDERTASHSQRVQRYAVELLDLVDPGRVEGEPGIEYGFLLHDIGKIAIPDQILQKPGPLTRTERKRMQTHTVLGEQMLGGVAVLRGEGLRIVRSHHERWDGRGYPDGLAGADVPLGARVFAVADALDAMTSDRPYRRALKWRDASAEIVAQSGKQFDPEVVDAFREREPVLRDVQRELAVALGRASASSLQAACSLFDDRALAVAQRYGLPSRGVSGRTTQTG
jgi:response regulator RpfG family c-di-GMP phosphodiesterase